MADRDKEYTSDMVLQKPQVTTPPTDAAKSSAAASGANTEECLLTIGGFKSGHQPNKDIIVLDREGKGSIMTQIPEYAPSVCVVDESIIVSGGLEFTGTSVSTVKIYSLASSSWADLPDMPQPVFSHGLAHVDGKIYSMGGECRENGQDKGTYSAVNVLDLASHKWSECTDLPQAVTSPGVAVVDEQFLVIGGNLGEGWSPQVFKYHTISGKWSQCQDIPEVGPIQCSTVTHDRQTFVLHRFSFLQYDIKADQWNKLALPTKPSFLPAMACMDGRLIALGGYEENRNPIDRVQTYDVSSQKWTVEEWKMPVALCGHYAIVMKILQRS